VDEKLLDAIAGELQVTPRDLKSESPLSSFEMWDSVTALTVMVLLGDTLGVPVEPAEMAKLETFGDIEALVRSKQK
jgi:acyl carrier protein